MAGALLRRPELLHGLISLLRTTDVAQLSELAQGALHALDQLTAQLVATLRHRANHELQIRLGVVSKDGLTAVIARRYGAQTAWLPCALHVVMCVQQQMGEFGSVGQLATEVWGVQPWWPGYGPGGPGMDLDRADSK